MPGRIPPDRFPSAVESAAYFATVESLRLSEGDVAVDASVENGWFRLTIAYSDSPDSTLVQIQDRVGAVGGTALLCDGRLRVEMPCES